MMGGHPFDCKHGDIDMLYGDCLHRLAELPNDAAQLVFTSPPYNMNLRVRNGKHCSRQIVKEISTKYANYSDNLTMDEYLSFSVRVVTELLRVAPLVMYNVQFLTGNKSALYRLMGHFHQQLKEVAVWDKVNAQPAIGEGVLNSQYEAVLIFSRGEGITRQFKNAGWARGTLSNVWAVKRGKKAMPTHGATFPLELAELVVTSFSRKGETVLDPFAGTGTSGEAALRHGRRYVGIELDAGYYAFALQRLLNTERQLR